MAFLLFRAMTHSRSITEDEQCQVIAVIEKAPFGAFSLFCLNGQHS